MTVDVESTPRNARYSLARVELLEFFAQKRACDDRDLEIVCSDVKALARGIRNALLAVTPFWLTFVSYLLR